MSSLRRSVYGVLSALDQRPVPLFCREIVLGRDPVRPETGPRFDEYHEEQVLRQSKSQLLLTALASRSKRSRRVGSSARCSGRTLMAWQPCDPGGCRWPDNFAHTTRAYLIADLGGTESCACCQGISLVSRPGTACRVKKLDKVYRTSRLEATIGSNEFSTSVSGLLCQVGATLLSSFSKDSFRRTATVSG